jgi:ubiquitin-activating enzyme E1
LKHFPNQIEHTLPWAREWFEEVFKQAADDINQYLTNPDYYAQLSSNNQQNMKYETVKRLKESLVTQRPNNINDCVTWARNWFEELFSNRIKQLLFNFPLDRLTSSGTPFWSGAKKPPTPVEFDPTDPLHAEFIVSVANMRASVYQIPLCEDKAYMLAVASSVKVEPFKPAEGIKIAATEEELKAESENSRRVAEASSSADIDVVCNSIVASIPSRESFGSFIARPVDFDKDIDSHMKVVAAASNLRARNYRIPEADMHTSRGIAGKITPAIATTTALVTGGICLEIFKLLMNKPADELANTFSNLAIPIFTSMEPEPPKYVKSVIRGSEWKWSPWDRIDINQPNMTVTELIAHLDEKYGLELSMLSSGVTILFSDFMDRKKKMVSYEFNFFFFFHPFLLPFVSFL